MKRVTYWDDEYGCWSYHCSSGDAAKLLSPPMRTPGWTPEEVKLAEAIKLVYPTAKYAQCEENGPRAALAVIKNEHGKFLLIDYRFPSLKPGETVLLSDIIGGEENA